MGNTEREAENGELPSPAREPGHSMAWAGVLDDGARPLFARLTRAAAPDELPALDVPGLGLFRVPLVRTNGARGAHLRAPIGAVGDVVISGELTGDDLHGVLASTGSKHPFVLRRVALMDGPAFAAAIGAYDGGRRSILLSMRGDDAARIPFYLEGDALVRLYPLGTGVGRGEYLSERCEVVSLEGDGSSALVIRAPDGSECHLARSTPYEERPFPIVDAAVELSGTLLIPHEAKRCAAVVLMHGSQPGERDFYRIYADRFARAGIAALVFDKRGFGRSEGSRDSSLEDRANDAAAAVGQLRQLAQIDNQKVGLWAFSNGTWSAPMVAARLEDPAFLVAVGAAGVSPAAAETHRKLVELREWGVPDALVAEAQHAWGLAYSAVTGARLRDGWEAEFEEVVERLHAAPEIAAIPLADYARANPWLAPIPPRATDDVLRALVGAFPEMAYDPVADYARVRCPVLFLVGSDDPNVPAREGALRVWTALEGAGHREHEVAVVAGAAHFMNSIGGPVRGMSVAEASGELHNFNFVPGYLERVTDWIVAQTH